MTRRALLRVAHLSLLTAGLSAAPGFARAPRDLAPETLVFSDGFESGSFSAWLGEAISGSGSIQTSDLVTHTYFYRIPGTPAPAKGRPALIWLHGDGGSGGGGFGAAFYPFTDPDGAIVVTPSGINQTWTHAASDLAGQPLDEQFLSLLVDKLIDEGIQGASVDPARIYVGGVSRGAYVPYFLLQRPSTKFRFAAVAVNAGLLYCQAGDTDCDVGGSSAAHHDAPAAILHLHGTDDTSVEPPPTATFHDPVDWNIDWRVFWPMKLWAEQTNCYDSGTTGGNDNGVLLETYTANGHTAKVYDLSGWGPFCAQYQLILVTNGGHVIAGQEGRIWSFLRNYALVGG
ncbi:MAG: hypothetical protein ABI639_16080 [Thermoanaerobaculia bacterium]